MGARRQRSRAEAVTAGPSRAAVTTPIAACLKAGNANSSSRMRYIDPQLNAFIERFGL
jgi:hypothetical protein